MNKLFVALVLTLPMSAQADDALFRKSGCIGCHQAQARVVGPSLKEVAAKYKDRKDAVEYLAGKIRNGGSGVWGAMAMPKQPHVSEADAKLLAQYIMTVK